MSPSDSAAAANLGPASAVGSSLDDMQDGHFRRRPSAFREFVRADTGAEQAFPARSGRYHLYISHACPWAHRTLLVRFLKGLESHISLSVTHPEFSPYGWSFDDAENTRPDPHISARYVRDLYLEAASDYAGRFTVPILWDIEGKTIVNNESAEIIRMFNAEFEQLDCVDTGLDLYPEPLRNDIDRVNERVYETVNNGVYRCGFASTQAAYEECFVQLFDTLDWLEGILGRQRYLAGEVFTEADLRLWTTLVRFDSVYFTHFKCNRRRIVDYPNLWGFTREIYQMPGFAERTFLADTKRHYYRSHTSLNPRQIVPMGPELDWQEAHNRG